MALIVLVALTMIGIVSTDNTVVELQIVRNETIYRQNFYKAESAVIDGAQVMEDSILTIPPSRSWIQTLSSLPVPDYMEDVSNWKDSADPPTWLPLGAPVSTPSNNMDDPTNPKRNNTRYAAVFVKKVGSKKMTSPTSLYLYHVYGLFDSTSGQGRSMIRMGYNKRF